MISRRKMLAGAATAAVVAPVAAEALPARVIEKEETLDFVPCDGRALPIAGYEKLFEALGYSYGGSHNAFAFRVPDLRGRARVFDAQGLLARPDASTPVTMCISTGENAQVPAGTVLPMVMRDDPA